MERLTRRSLLKGLAVIGTGMIGAQALAACIERGRHPAWLIDVLTRQIVEDVLPVAIHHDDILQIAGVTRVTIALKRYRGRDGLSRYA